MKNLLIIGFIFPEPNATAAGTRMMQLIDLFQKNNYTITFISSASKTEKSIDLKEYNIETKEIKLNDASFDELLKIMNPSIVLFDRFITEEQFGWRVSEICPKAIRILDTEDLHFLRNARQTAIKNNEKLTENLLFNEIAKREIASIYRCDLSLIISKYEFELLRNTFKIDKSLLFYIPFLLDKSNFNTINAFPTFEERSNFISVGNFKHEPNWNAVVYLKKEIWPKIREKLPNSELHIYGAYCTEKVFQLNNIKEGFIVKGWVENIEDVYKNAKICLAPIQFGAGLKGKLINAMEFGTPSVTTTIGAEAMHDKLPWNGFICDNPKAFSLKSVELYLNKGIWEEFQTNGFKIIDEIYSKTKFYCTLIGEIEKIQATLELHRKQNFIGSMLLHHTLKSTKYMSKWIEEKNKN